LVPGASVLRSAPNTTSGESAWFASGPLLKN
jgi:hypothetical protein